MKEHLILKLHRQLSDDRDMPDWTTFINDKSVMKESLTPDVDSGPRANSNLPATIGTRTRLPTD
jgi:hypothetical protein